MQLAENTIIAVLGLGYVGLPLALAFGSKFRTIGFDLKIDSIESFKNGVDPNGEATSAAFGAATDIEFTADPTEIAVADFIILAVPTPIDKARQPDLSPLLGAAKTAGTYMKKGAVVIFESTVYPGVTEEECVPVLEAASNMRWREDFHVGYSPERINPGDTEHTLTTIVKIVSGDDKDTLEAVSALYESIVEAGVCPTATIKEAEAAKVIENTQRDLNIALMNELAVIFDRLGIDTVNVLRAAGTKWNFLPFRPGLVGGHCIGVDPYYLTYKAETERYHPEVILAGRRRNDMMGKFIGDKTIKMMLAAKLNICEVKVGVLGLTFKEDCPDLRNSKVVDIIQELESYGVEVLVYDPKVDPLEVEHVMGIKLCAWEELQDLGALVFAVPHRELLQLGLGEIAATLTDNGCLIDVKSVLDVEEMEKYKINFWRL